MSKPTFQTFWDDYDDAYREAILRARHHGTDVGISRAVDLSHKMSFKVYTLPLPENRFGPDLRAEVVKPDGLLPEEHKCIDCGSLEDLAITRYGAICVPCIDKAYAMAMEAGDEDE